MVEKYVRLVASADADPLPEGRAVASLAFVDEGGNPVDIGSGGGGGSSITSVEVTTLDAGEEATAAIDGTTLKLGIPKGDKGDTGETGAAGATGATGAAGAAATVTVGSVASGETASVTNSGTSSAAVLDFVLPKGDKGDTGDTGPQGATGATGAAGAAGEDGEGVASIALTTDAEGKVTGGTWAGTKGGGGAIDVTAASE